MTTDKVTAELKPCPFCGNSASLVSGGPGNHYVRCFVCQASSDDASRERTVELWNRRALEPSPKAAPIEELVNYWPSKDETREAMARALYEHWVAENIEDDWAGWERLGDKETWLSRADAALAALPIPAPDGDT